MTGIEFDGKVKFILTDDLMNTIIEPISNIILLTPQRIILNNLAICSIAEQGQLFCDTYAAQQPDKKLPVEAPIFHIHAEFFNDKYRTIILHQNGVSITCNYEMFYNYYTEILAKIVANEKNMNSGYDFEKENIEEIKVIKKTNPHPRDKRKKEWEDLLSNDNKEDETE